MTLVPVATLRLTSRTSLVISRGSVLDFVSRCANTAIVNAANEGCLGGGGVDGAVSKAGGNALLEARMALPCLDQDHCVRCLTGDAKLSGPGKFGDIKTNHVIHAVGPYYSNFKLWEYEEADALLQSAYSRALAVAHDAQVKEVAFSLLSAGVYKGRRSLKQVLRLGVASIRSWANVHSETSVELIVLCAFLESEATALVEVAKELGLEFLSEDDGNLGTDNNLSDATLML